MIFKNRLVILFGILLSMVYSCKTTTEVTTSGSTSVITKTYESKTKQISPNSIFQKPQVAELDVKKQRVKMVKTYDNIGITAAKELAKGDFMVQEKCDVIVEPYLFTSTETNESGSKTTVTLTAYPANYINIKNYEKKDEVFFTLPNHVN